MGLFETASQTGEEPQRHILTRYLRFTCSLHAGLQNRGMISEEIGREDV